jgi:hypothetical protein
MGFEKPRRKFTVHSAVALALLALVSSAALKAQPRVGEIVRLEDQRIEAVRAGQGVARFYDSAYRGITALGQYETIEQIRAIKQEPAYARHDDAIVELHGNVAIVTGIEGAIDAGERERVLRIWTRDNGAWTIAAAQTTWIGNRTGAPPPAGPLPNTPPEAYAPRNATEEALWTSQNALMRSFSDADPATYRLFSTENSLRMATNGDAIPREQWLNTIARRAKGPLAVVDEVRIAAYGDVGVITLRGHEANPTRQSWIYLKQDGVWKLALRYTTVIRQ